MSADIQIITETVPETQYQSQSLDMHPWSELKSDVCMHKLNNQKELNMSVNLVRDFKSRQILIMNNFWIIMLKSVFHTKQCTT